MGAVRQKKVAKIETTYVKEQEYSHIAASRKKKILYRRLSVFLVFAILTAYFMVSSILSQASSIEAKAAEKKQLDRKLAELKNEQRELKDNIVKLNDDEYIAKLARKEYFLSNKDEIIFNIPDEGKEK